MNAVDIVQLKLFLAELARARVTEKDHRAEELIRLMLERQPDAPYLLAQRVMQLESALCAARAGASDAVRGPGVAGASGHSAADAARRRDEPWWRKTVPGFAATEFLFRSTDYLLGDRERGITSPGAP